MTPSLPARARARWPWATSIASLLLACADTATPPPAPCEPPLALTRSTNPLDLAIAPAFATACLDVIAEEPGALCRRLHVDLLGHLPTAAELTDRCTATDRFLRELQADPRYLLHSERRWRDLFRITPDADWHYTRDLFALTNALHTGTLRYDDFIARALASPALAISRFFEANAFRAFLGREPTMFESEDFARLFAMWGSAYRRPAADNLPVSETGATVDPFACLALGGCRSILFGDTEVVLELDALTAYEDLDGAARGELENPGRALAGDPLIYEAAAGAILDRFLGWDDDNFLPRTPGALHPRVRLALADYLRETNDYPAAERLVLSSALYTQASLGDRPVFATGPLQATPNEVLLESMLAGAPCDPRYPLDRYRFELLEQHRLGNLDDAELDAAFTRLEELLEPRASLRDPRAYDLATLLGGCDTTRRDRGLYFALAHESAVDAICATATETNLDAIMRRHLARDPTAAERDAIAAALEGCTTDCASALCTAVLGSGEMLFY